MARKRYKPEETSRSCDRWMSWLAGPEDGGRNPRDRRESEVTYYRWCQEFGGLKTEQVKRLKYLETENARLRRAVSDLTLDKLILQEAARGNF
jgi:putative transposase